ncbi:MAG: TonB-dependent receptor, partial [Brevundimonas sp.]|nr:TonB-dependent receptor [Brevundimonas sp.]
RLVPTGEFDTVVIEHGTTEWLPSLNATIELKEDLLLRGGLFRAMSRPAPSALGAGRVIQVDSGADYANVADAISNITANGSPRLEPLMSWNADLSLEYYANRDSLFSLAVYAKQFTGGFEPVAYDETFTIDGQAVVGPGGPDPQQRRRKHPVRVRGHSDPPLLQSAGAVRRPRDQDQLQLRRPRLRERGWSGWATWSTRSPAR